MQCLRCKSCSMATSDLAEQEPEALNARQQATTRQPAAATRQLAGAGVGTADGDGAAEPEASDPVKLGSAVWPSFTGICMGIL